MKVHDEEEEARKEKEASKRNGGDDLSSMGMYIHVDTYIYIILSLFLCELFFNLPFSCCRISCLFECNVDIYPIHTSDDAT